MVWVNKLIDVVSVFLISTCMKTSKRLSGFAKHWQISRDLANEIFD